MKQYILPVGSPKAGASCFAPLRASDAGVVCRRTKRLSSHAICVLCLVDYNDDHGSCLLATASVFFFDCYSFCQRDSTNAAGSRRSGFGHRATRQDLVGVLYLSEARHSQLSLASPLYKTWVSRSCWTRLFILLDEATYS
jgi:hypothetical protein